MPPGILPLPQAPHPRLHPTLPTPQTALRGNFSTTQCSEEDSTQFMLPRILSPCSALPGILVPHALASGKHSLPDNGILPSSHCCPGAHLRTAQCSPGRAASLTLYQIHLLLRPPLGRTRCSTHGSTGEYLLLRLRPTGGRCSLNTLLYWDSFYPTHRSPRAPTPHVALQGIFLIGQCNIWDTNLARGHFLPDITSPGTAPYHIHHSSGETSYITQFSPGNLFLPTLLCPEYFLLHTPSPGITSSAPRCSTKAEEFSLLPFSKVVQDPPPFNYPTSLSQLYDKEKKSQTKPIQSLCEGQSPHSSPHKPAPLGKHLAPKWHTK